MKDDERKRMERAARVKAILDGDEWKDAWAAYTALLLNVIETSDDDEEALRARRMLRAARGARKALEALIADGALAKAEMAAQKSRLRIG